MGPVIQVQDVDFKIRYLCQQTILTINVWCLLISRKCADRNLE